MFNLNNTLFGPTAFRDADNANDISYKANGKDYSDNAMNHIKAVFKPAVVTDLNIGYNFTEKVSFSISINNILNVLPKLDLEVNSIETDAAKKTAASL